jgi:hypothetical protein
MYQLLTSLSRSDLLAQQLPTFVMAFAIAEMFYKFHSFTLETAAFLATWFVLDWAAGRLRGVFSRPDGANSGRN